ncbi:14735_t:CDS:1, partial [Racocetra fulgida]
LPMTQVPIQACDSSPTQTRDSSLTQARDLSPIYICNSNP